jgi:predicted SAM-dependent methyltransferase
MKRVQFACGGNRPATWENYDMDVDLNNPLPFHDDSVDAVLIEHALEHFPSPQAIKIVEEVRRILVPGGVFRLCIPVVYATDLDNRHIELERQHVRDLLVNHGHCMGLNRNLVITMLWASGFELEKIVETGRKDCDGHHKVIGAFKDDIETFRCEATK